MVNFLGNDSSVSASIQKVCTKLSMRREKRLNDELLQLCKWLNEKRDMATSSRLIPLVDDLTHILIEAGKNKLH